ncbi:6-hydroxymethylpterin diphosphokinase MptE-like protein [Paenibacillus sp. NEAU-GSW1]|uniref:motility associated factor glycosyltransferase family protein n=1 Tax=Paenibacillus sp. NEAU-GSW1 TaxID=2682486 RepID=UPI0012E32898|nr:6-hydroxymethylpterin diphosphokinase MptE-like protein [Paenibacillus sp. NEAU-GSW1]MUT65009.1 DUF115 domain-containing protein [Paenibacillus sp. NEAU-GSW1]
MNRVEADGYLEAIKPFLPELIAASSNVAELLYEPINEQTWQQFGEIVEGIDDLFRTLKTIDTLCNDDAGVYEFTSCIDRAIESIQESFYALNDRMDEEDYAGAAECIRFELIPIFSQLARELGDNQMTMDNRFAANMQFLKRHYSKVYARMKAFQDGAHYSVTYARNGMPNIRVAEEGRKPHYIHSQFDPLQEADRWVEYLEKTVRNKSVIMMYGFGNGYLAQSYGRSYPEHILYIYEPDERAFAAAMRAIDMDQLLSSLNIEELVVGTEPTARERLVDVFSTQRGGQEIVILPAYRKRRNAEVMAFFREIKDAVLNYSTLLYNHEQFGMTWIRNNMFNLEKALNTPSINGLKDRFKGMTAVIVGAGPSLEQDIALLKQMRSHALVIAAGSTIQSLLHYGVEPHLIVSIDGSEANYNAFHGLNIEDIPLLFAPMLQYQIIESRAEKLLHTFISADPTTKHFMNLTEADPIFQTTFSVTGTAIQAAIYMGCDEIVFSGQDLSYPGDKMYASGADHFSEESMKTTVNQAVLQVENVSGGKNRTNQAMMQTLQDIENLIASFPNVRFINTSRAGAKIKHTLWESMESVLSRYYNRVVDEKALIREMAAMPLYDHARVRKTHERINRLPEQIKQCEQSLKWIVQQVNLLSKMRETELDKCSSVIDKIDDAWLKITKGSPFNGLFIRACWGGLKRLEVQLYKLKDANSVSEQADFYCEYMKPLVQEMLNVCPELIEISVEAKVRLGSVV